MPRPPKPPTAVAAPLRLTPEEKDAAITGVIPLCYGEAGRACRRNPGLDFDEVFSDLLGAALTSADKFDKNMKTKFVTFAHWLIVKRSWRWAKKGRPKNRPLNLYVLTHEEGDTPGTGGRAGLRMRNHQHVSVVEAAPAREPPAPPVAWTDAEWADLLRPLSGRYRRVIVGRYVEGATYAELAREMGCTRENVRQREKLALEQLRYCRGAWLEAEVG